MSELSPIDKAKFVAAKQAMAYVEDGMKIGLGSGSTAAWMVKCLGEHVAEQGLNIRCNSIHPAAILTPMWEPMLGDGPDREARMAAFVADTPMRRFGTVEEVASIALLLASDEAAYMTGTELTVDGGLLAGSAVTPQTS